MISLDVCLRKWCRNLKFPFWKVGNISLSFNVIRCRLKIPALAVFLTLSLQLARIQSRPQSNSDFYETGVSKWQQHKVHVRYYTSEAWCVPASLLLEDVKERIFLMCQHLAGMLTKGMGGASRSVEDLICN